MDKITTQKSAMDRFQENLIALLLGLMTITTFANVVARYAFNSNIFWALEVTVFLFAWLVLLGASYAVKIRSHLGVDAIISMVSPRARWVMGMASVIGCLIFSLILLKGSWDYWAPYANLPPLEGRVIPTGFVENTRGQGWYETQDIPVPFFLKWLEDVFNGGAEYEKLPKVVPYLIMPLAAGLMVYRFAQATRKMYTGEITSVIVSHEAEDDVEEAAQALKD